MYGDDMGGPSTVGAARYAAERALLVKNCSTLGVVT